jgi:hypothetical protein
MTEWRVIEGEQHHRRGGGAMTLHRVGRVLWTCLLVGTELLAVFGAILYALVMLGYWAAQIFH